MACALLSVLSVACGDGERSEIGARRLAVSGGELSGNEDNAVVRVISRQPKPYPDVSCSGALVAPNVLLTALHCVSVYNHEGGFRCRADGSLAPPDLGYGWIGEPLDPARVEVSFGLELPPRPDALGLRIFGSGSAEVCVDDIAVVVLDRELPARGYAVRRERPVVAGELMTVVGFGWSDLPDAVRVRREGVPIIAVGPDETSEGVGKTMPRSFLVGDGPCDGDSGGPALSAETSAVAGIFSLNFGGDCRAPGSQHSFTKVAPFARLLDRAFEFAGTRPTLEPAPAASSPAASSSGCTLGIASPQTRHREGAMTAFFAVVVVMNRRRKSARAHRGEAR